MAKMINGIDTDICLCHKTARVKHTGETEVELWCDECMLVPDKYKGYWGQFTCFNPVQAEAYKILEKDSKASIIAASGTGTGKSTIAEMAIIKYFERIGGNKKSLESITQEFKDDGWDDDTIEMMVVEELQDDIASEGKVLVLQPLKALAHEKSEDWKEMFPELNVCSLTSDDDIGYGAERNAKLNQFDIVVCSYEMLDSMSRKPTVYTFLDKVGLLIVDEIHELADRGRGGGLDGTLTRFLRYRRNMGFNTQMIGLSATFENSDDLKSWLEKFIHTVHIVYKDFSPIKAVIDKRIGYYGFGGREESVIGSAYSMARTIDGPIIMMMLSKPAVKKVTALLNEGHYGKDCARYHFADLDATERHLVEDGYRAGEFRFLVATPTLLAGVNMPAQGIILDISYFNTDEFETDVLPIQKINQAKGRVGRLPYYNTGMVSYVCDSRVSDIAESRLLETNIVKGTLFYTIDSVINAEVNISPITLQELSDWYQLTFSKFGNDFNDYQVKDMLHDMVKWLKEHDYINVITELTETRLMINQKGSMAARIMISPRLIENILDVLKLYEKANLEEQSVLDNIFISFWSHPMSEVSMNSNKIAALYKFNFEQNSKKLKGKRSGEFDWIKNVRFSISRLTPFVEKYANLEQRKIWLKVCNHFIKYSVADRIAMGWVTIR